MYSQSENYSRKRKGRIMSLIDVLSKVKKTTISRNSRRSINWLKNKLHAAFTNGEAKAKFVPRVGRMYIFSYKAKTETLPFYDANPLIICVGAAKGGFYGLNFHYLPIKDRISLLKLITPFNLKDAKNRKNIRISYSALVKLSSTHWKPCFKHYLFSQAQTKYLEVSPDEWIETISLPVAHFNGATYPKVYSWSRKRF